MESTRQRSRTARQKPQALISAPQEQGYAPSRSPRKKWLTLFESSPTLATSGWAFISIAKSVEPE